MTYTLYPKYWEWEDKDNPRDRRIKRNKLIEFACGAKTLVGVKDAKIYLHPNGEDKVFIELEEGIDNETLGFLYTVTQEIGLSFPVELKQKVTGE